MIPSVRFILLVLLAAPLFLVGAFIEAMTAIGILYVGFLALWALSDMLLATRKSRILTTRVAPVRFSLGVPTRVIVKVENSSRRTVHLRLAERLSEGMEVVREAPEVRLGPGERRQVEYRLLARRRGKYLLSQMDVRVRPKRGLFIRQFRRDLPQEIQVFPNLANVRKYEWQLRKGLAIEQGLARLRKIGQGSEFESLRLYAHGDDLGHVDWKATAKRAELLVRNYQPERQQSVLVAIDVGRATAGEFEGINRLDYLVNSTLMLAYAALRHGDWFSLVAFSDQIESYLPPVRNIKCIEQVAQALYRLEPKLTEADYAMACRFLGLKSRKRSLICLMTDVIDRQASDVMIAYMSRFARRHLPLVVTLANTEIMDAADQPLAKMTNPYRKAAALDVMTARKEALVAMRRYGVGVLDVPPKAMTPELITRYIEIKSSGRL